MTGARGCRRQAARRALVVLAAALCWGACGDGGRARTSQLPPDWRSFGGDPGSMRYAPLAQIDASNFGDLRIVWTWRAAPNVTGQRPGFRHPITPLVVDGRLYGVTGTGVVFALDASTGAALWVSNEATRVPTGAAGGNRGLTYWSGDGDERIFLVTRGAALVALDARTGRRVESFGDGGVVDLLEGLRAPRTIERVADYSQTSPAALYRDTLIVGSTISDTPRSMRDVPGDVRAYDARTGEQKWAFHVIPSDGEPGTETWEDESWRYTGAANVWAPMSVDVERGTVFFGTSSPTNDAYGGHRLGDNLYSDTLVCLDAESGRRIWHQQLVRHDLWDYDLASPPVLATIEGDGQATDVVAQVTKQGFTFVFERETGEPIWPIEERAVPASDVDGEQAAPTQRFPTKPPPFERQGMREEDLIALTPEFEAQALEIFRRYRAGPLFTPPSQRGTLLVPGPSAGTSWHGAAFDPETGLLYVPSTSRAGLMGIARGHPSLTDMRFVTGGRGDRWVPDGRWTPGALPLIAPPWSQITAIDLRRGEISWQRPNGVGPRDHPALAGIELPELGSGGHTGLLVTSTLLFASGGTDRFHESIGEATLIAYDKATGVRIGTFELPAKMRGLPISYRHSGKQYLAFSIGNEDLGPAIVALALP